MLSLFPLSFPWLCHKDDRHLQTDYDTIPDYEGAGYLPVLHVGWSCPLVLFILMMLLLFFHVALSIEIILEIYQDLSLAR